LWYNRNVEKPITQTKRGTFMTTIIADNLREENFYDVCDEL